MFSFIDNPQKYPVNKPIKLKKKHFFPSFPWTFTQKEPKNATKIKFTTKHCMLRATNLHQPRQFYTYAVGDVGGILSTSRTSILGFNFTNVCTFSFKHWPWYSLGSSLDERNLSLLVQDNLRMQMCVKALRVLWWMESLGKSRGQET